MVMSEPAKIVYAKHDTERGTLASYTTGFVLSIIFTVWAYLSVIRHVFSAKLLVVWLLVLAVVQFVVQLLFFLHIGKESKPRWRRLTLVLMLVFVLIVVLGSIWIMYNLNVRMTPAQVNQYMSQQAGSGF